MGCTKNKQCTNIKQIINCCVIKATNRYNKINSFCLRQFLCLCSPLCLTSNLTIHKIKTHYISFSILYDCFGWDRISFRASSSFFFPSYSFKLSYSISDDLQWCIIVTSFHFIFFFFFIFLFHLLLLLLLCLCSSWEMKI